MKKSKVTFADIAKYTGFSKTTISRYFNNPDSLTLENQSKIAQALEALDYKENKLAKVLANGKTYDLAVAKAGEVVAEDIKWIKDTDGKYKVVVTDLE